MSRTSPSGALRRGLRFALLCTAAVALAGCATSYDLVQPQASGSGSYYTGAGPYGGGYAAGSYYPAASVYGYSTLQPYVFTSAFDFGFPGTFGWGYPWAFGGGFGYPFAFAGSFGNPWGWGGWGYAPWYNNFALPPVWGCGYHRCHRHRNWQHHEHGQHGHSTSFAAGRLATPPALLRADGRGIYPPGLHVEALNARRVTPALVAERPMMRAPVRRLDLARPMQAGAPIEMDEPRPMRPAIDRMEVARPLRMGGDAMRAMRPAPVMRDFAPAPAFHTARPAATARPMRMQPMRSFSPPPAPIAAPRATPHSRVR